MDVSNFWACIKHTCKRQIPHQISSCLQASVPPLRPSNQHNTQSPELCTIANTVKCWFIIWRSVSWTKLWTIWYSPRNVYLWPITDDACLETTNVPHFWFLSCICTCIPVMCTPVYNYLHWWCPHVFCVSSQFVSTLPVPAAQPTSLISITSRHPICPWNSAAQLTSCLHDE